MKRPVGYGSLLVAGVCALGAWAIPRSDVSLPPVGGIAGPLLALKLLSAGAIVFGTYGAYLLVARAVHHWVTDKRRVHDIVNVVRLLFVAAGVVGLAGVVTEQWVGVLFSLGIVGFAITFALQQPLLSLLGWVYIMTKRPYQVGDRVKIEEAKGDVVEVDFLVTTLWEIGGDLVAGHQPSGRVVTVPNSVVIASQVYNYSREEFPYVWNELTMQVSYETDLAFAREEMRRVADDYLGDEMERHIEQYREELSATPVELDVNPRPTVNVRQEESWVELRLRYLAHPKRMQATRNALYERILERFQTESDRVSYPIGRPR